jgi:hypothetical protein
LQAFSSAHTFSSIRIDIGSPTLDSWVWSAAQCIYPSVFQIGPEWVCFVCVGKQCGVKGVGQTVWVKGVFRFLPPGAQREPAFDHIVDVLPSDAKMALNYQGFGPSINLFEVKYW